jgi:drug/metabolite transporter (DMT)-like permease
LARSAHPDVRRFFVPHKVEQPTANRTLLPEGYGLGARDSVPRAVAYMLMSSASFAAMGAMVKAAGDLPVHEKVFFRNLVTLAITAAIAWRRRENPFGPTRNLPLLLARSAAGLVGVFFYFYAIGHLTLADASLLNKIAPFFVTLLAVTWLGETLRPRVALGLVLAFAGAALVIRPTFALHPLPTLAGLGSALGAGTAYAIVRRLKGREHPRRIVFYFSLISTLVMAVPLAVHAVEPTPWQWVWLLGTGVFAAGGQIFLTMAYHHAPAAQISIFTYNHVLFALIIGMVVWGEHPSPLTYAGGALIVIAAVMNRNAR